MEHRKRIQTTSRSLRSDRPNRSVGRYVATDPRTSRSLRSDQPSHIDQSANESVAIDQATRSVPT